MGLSRPAAMTGCRLLTAGTLPQLNAASSFSAGEREGANFTDDSNKNSTAAITKGNAINAPVLLSGTPPPLLRHPQRPFDFAVYRCLVFIPHPRKRDVLYGKERETQ